MTINSTTYPALAYPCYLSASHISPMIPLLSAALLHTQDRHRAQPYKTITTHLPIDTYARLSPPWWAFLRSPPALHGYPGLLTVFSVPASRLQRRCYSYHDGQLGRGLGLCQAGLASSAPATLRCSSLPHAQPRFSFSSSCCSLSTQPMPRRLPSEVHLYRPKALQRSHPLFFLFFLPPPPAAQEMKSARRSGSTRRDFGLANRSCLPFGSSSWYLYFRLRRLRQQRHKQRQQRLPDLPGGSCRGRIFATSQRRTGRTRGARRGRTTAQ